MLAFVVNAMTCTTGFLSNRAGLTNLTKRVQLLLDSTFSSSFFFFLQSFGGNCSSSNVVYGFHYPEFKFYVYS